MGSDFSFSNLCLVTWLSHIEASGRTEFFLSLSDKDLKKAVIEDDTCGVNGDDLVDWGDDGGEVPQWGLAGRWVDAYPLTGGVPAPEKSPSDPEYFTINSQLWKFPKQPNSKPFNCGAVLPAMLMNLGGKRHVAPDRSWCDLLRSPLLSRYAINEFRLDLLLLPDVPRQFGGLGSIRPNSFERLAFALLSRPKNWHDLTENDSGEILRSRGHVSVLQGLEEVKERDGRRVSGFVRIERKKEEAIEAFGSPRALHWTEGHMKERSSRTIRHQLRTISDPDNKHIEFARIVWFYERRGWVYVHSIVDDGNVKLAKDPVPTFRHTVLEEYSERKYEKEKKLTREGYQTQPTRLYLQ